eukprot:m.224887 g.224887  ORF g.224887 m.224887 type:complete len:435 (-) comp16573_c0_seq1:368-1672(-)
MNSDLSSDKRVSSLRAQQPLREHGYMLGETVGIGGYSKVKLATSTASDRKQFAIKIIAKSKAPQAFLDKFLPREIMTLKRLRHHNIVELMDVVDLPDRVCLVMEYADGGDLLEYVNARGFLEESHAAKLFAQLVDAVAYCHRERIIHRDLKCENILINSKGVIKVSDFGFATLVPTASSPLKTHCGSYAYAAPEILHGQNYDGTRTDTWSLGVILYAMTVGRLPFNDSNLKILLTQIGRPLELPTRLSRGLCDLIQIMLAVQAAERATLFQVLQHPWLLTLAGSTAAGASGPAPAPAPTSTTVPAPAPTPAPVAATTPAAASNVPVPTSPEPDYQAPAAPLPAPPPTPSSPARETVSRIAQRLQRLSLFPKSKQAGSPEDERRESTGTAPPASPRDSVGRTAIAQDRMASGRVRLPPVVVPGPPSRPGSRRSTR